MIALGADLPAFELRDLENRVQSPQGLGPLGLLVFFKEGCPTCEFSLPFFQRLHCRYPDLAILGVCQESPEVARALKERLALTFPVAWELEPYPVSSSCGLCFVPSWVTVDDLRVSGAGSGWVRAEFEALVERLAGKFGVTPEALLYDDVPDWRPG